MLRCEAYVVPENDLTGENAIKCNAIAFACVNCGDTAGCEEHALKCPRCGEPVCDHSAYEHRCVTKSAAKVKTKRAA